MKQIRIVLAEDYHLVRHSLAALLSDEPDFLIVGEASDGVTMLDLVDRVRPDVLVMEMQMPDHDPFTAVQQLEREQPETAIIVLATTKSPSRFLSLLETHVQGYVLKNDRFATLVEAIRTVAAGHRWVSPQIADSLVEAVRGSTQKSVALTEREREVLRLVGLGLNNEEIGARLDLATSTVANYVSRILNKVGVETRIQAALYALSVQLVQIEEVRQLFEQEE